MTAAELMKLFKAKKASPVEAVQHSLEQIRQLNPVLNAFCFVDEQSALADARASEQRWYAGCPLSALDGIPIGIKDVILTRGWPTLCGSRAIDPAQPWLEDAPVVARLRESGAVLIGKTTTAEMGCKTVTESSLHGVTINPCNPLYSAGGSSGGSAVAVAADLVPVAIGTDYAGSIRHPSALCGVTGFKPSFGRVPSIQHTIFNCGSAGPIAKSVQDIANTMKVITKSDYRDVLSLPPDHNDYALTQSMAGLRVAYSPTLGFNQPVDADVMQGLVDTVEKLKKLGAVVEHADPVIDDPEQLIYHMWAIDAQQIWQNLDANKRSLTDKLFQRQAIDGIRFKDETGQLLIKQRQLSLQMRTFMQSYDIILTSGIGVIADARLPIIDPKSNRQLYVFNLTGQPAISIPTGHNKDGMPLSVQLAGNWHADAQVLQVAHAIKCNT